MSADHIVGNAAPGFPWRGHHCRLLDLAALAVYEREVFSHHFAALQEMRELCTDEQYDRQLSEVRSAKAAGAYSLKGPAGQAWAGTQDGAVFLLGLILDYDGARGVDTTAVLFDDPKGAAEMLRQVMIDSGLLPSSPPAAAGPAPPF